MFSCMGVYYVLFYEQTKIYFLPYKISLRKSAKEKLSSLLWYTLSKYFLNIYDNEYASFIDIYFYEFFLLL
jgi:hypothetical protein